MRRDNERKKTEEREREKERRVQETEGREGAKEGSTTNNLELLGRCMRGNGGRSISAPKD